jgi:hypothetical protein
VRGGAKHVGKKDWMIPLDRSWGILAKGDRQGIQPGRTGDEPYEWNESG